MEWLGQDQPLPHAVRGRDRVIQCSLSTPIRTQRVHPRQVTGARRVLPDPVVLPKS